MFNRILVTVDNSEGSRQVFETALSMTKAADTRLMLLHVLSSEEIDYAETCRLSNLDAHPTIKSKAQFRSKESQSDEARAWKILRSLQQAAATTAGITADLALLPGDLGQVVCEMACRWGADLIILGRQGSIGLNKSMFDSIGNFVTQHAPCSVLMLQHQAYSNFEVNIGNRVAAVL